MKVKSYKGNIIFGIVAVVIMFLILLYAGIQGSNVKKDQEAELEGSELYNKIEATSYEMNKISIKYSNNDIINFGEFSDLELEKYSDLIAEQKDNYNKYSDWIVSNEEYFKSTGKTDLAISETLKDIRSIKDQLGVLQITISRVKSMRDLI